MSVVRDRPVAPAAPRPRRPVLRRIRIAGFSALAALLVYLLLCLHFFVFPGEDPLPAHADVAVVLGPATNARVDLAYHLLDTGRVGAVLISVPLSQQNPYLTDHAWLDRCDSPSNTVCMIAEPSTTQGEARMLAQQAKVHGWRSAVVITQTAHLDRARTIIERCFTGTVAMRASSDPPEGGWLYQFEYQTTATVKAWFVTDSC